LNQLGRAYRPLARRATRENSTNLLIRIKPGTLSRWEMKAIRTWRFSMSTSTILVIAAVLCIFGVFALAVAYAQIQTKGMIAPGARQID